MMRTWKFILAVILCVAALVPPRLHAASFAHDHAAVVHHAQIDHARHHAHEGSGCDHGPASPAPVDLSQSVCMAACACLPAMPLPLPVAQPMGHGRKLALIDTALHALPQPEGLFRPPRTLS